MSTQSQITRQTVKSQGPSRQTQSRQTKAQQRIDGILNQAYACRRLAVPRQDKDRRAFQRRVKTGIIVMPYKGMYISSVQWESLSYAERITWAARTVCHEHPEWVLCGPSAAGAYGFTATLKLQKYVHIAVPDRSKAGRHGYVIAHYYRQMPPSNVVDGIRVTAELDTMADCARTLDFCNAMAICSTGLRMTNLSKDVFRDFVNEKSRIGGIVRARYVADRTEPACENGGEAVAIATMVELGYRQPRAQVPFTSPLDGGEIRADFLWERDDGTIVVGELDGRQKYIDPSMIGQGDSIDVILREKDRETELNMMRIDVVRFRMEHVYDRAQLRRRLDAAGIPRDPLAGVTPFVGFRSRAY